MRKTCALLALLVVFLLFMATFFAACGIVVMVEAQFESGSGAIGTPLSSISVASGSEITLPQNTYTKDGYQFVGWSDGSSVYQAGDRYHLSIAVTFVAQWEKVVIPPTTYTIIYTGGDDAIGNAPIEDNKQSGDTFVVAQNTFEKTGFEFGGWNDGERVYQEGAIYIVDDNDVTFVAVWHEIVVPTYSITYVGDSQTTGVVPVENFLCEGDTFEIAQNALVKSGYKFVGWSDGEKIYQEGDIYTVGSKNVMFVACWQEIEQYRIAYVGGVGTVGNSPIESDKIEGETFVVAENTYTKYNHNFIGWSDGENIYQAGDTYTVGTADVILTAVWEEITYTITYIGGDDTTGIAPTESDKVEGSTFVVAENTFAKDKHYFVGWNDGANVYLPGDTYIVGATNITFTAVWEEITYTVTYVGGDDTTGVSPIETDKVEGSIFVVAENTFAKDKHYFVGWTDGTNVYQAGDTYTVGTTNITFTAIWEEITYTITYIGGDNATGVAPIENDKVEGATFVIAENTFTKDKHYFVGWNDGTNVYLPGDTYTVGTTNITFTAIWEEITYTITYIGGDDATGIAPTESEKVEGATVVVAENTFAKDKHYFVGWSDGENLYQVGDTYIVGTTNITFTAVWEEITYAVTYVGGDNATGVAPIESDKVESATFTVAENTFTKEKHYFAGWTDGTNVYLPGDTYAVGTTNITFTAVWKEITYTITYVGGDDTTGIAPIENDKVEGVTFVVAENTFAKDKHYFVGWSDGTNVYLPGDTYTVGTTNITFTAVWKEITYTITYIGGDDATGIAPTESDKVEGATFVIAENTFEKSGYTFIGWSDGESVYQAGDEYTVATADVVFEAVWEQNSLPTYTIIYEGGEGATGVAPTESAKVEGATIYLKENTFEKVGYSFVCWYDGEKNCLVGESYTISNQDVVFIAVWEEIVYFTITFDLNVDGDETTPSYIDAQVVEQGSLATAPENPTRDGYLFKAWQKDGADYDFATIVDSDVTIVAKWVELCTVTFDANGASGVAPNDISVEIASEICCPDNTFEMGDCTFLGWQIGTSSKLLAEGEILVVNANCTLRPVFCKTYKGDLGELELWQNNEIAFVEGIECTYAQIDDVVAIYAEQELYFECKLLQEEYLLKDGMQNYTFVSSEGVALGFDGYGCATLGDMSASYQLGENDAFVLVVGESEYNLSIEQDGDNYVVNAIIENYVFGKGGKIVIVVTFELGDGVEGTLPQSIEEECYESEGITITLPDGTDFERTGYTFEGWIVDGADGEVLNGEQTVKTNTTYVAVWSVAALDPAQYWDIDSDGYITLKDGVTLPEVVTIPASVDEQSVVGIKGGTDYSPFYNSQNSAGVTTVIFEEGITIVDDYTFALSSTSTTSTLTTIVLPESLAKIGTSAFMNLSSLVSINLPSAVTYIGKNAFSSCTGLNGSTITFPTSLAQLGSSALSGILNAKIIIKSDLSQLQNTSGTVATISKNMFDASTVTIYVLDDLKSTLVAASIWTNFRSKMVNLSELTQ